MKKLITLAVAAAALIAAPAFADGTGVVNVAKILHDSKAATSVNNQMQAKQKALQAELSSKEKDLRAEDQALVKQEKDATDKAAFAKKVQDFKDKANKQGRDIQEKKVALEKSFAAALEEIQKNVLDITKQVAAEKKLNMVVSGAAVLYVDPSLDITDEVLKRLDAKLPNVTVKF